ncbi:MAG: hypothetical protein DMG58_24905 [Acidobacteria bacterium]|nr:MAG: hypothetical protein DMG58_24905 [Acidobacteriota bacterium]
MDSLRRCRLCETVEKVANSNVPVLIRGESGTGKDSRCAGRFWPKASCSAALVQSSAC